MQTEHRTVIIVGGGPAGLPYSVVLGGWHPYFRPSPIFSQRYAQLADYLTQHQGSLLTLDFQSLVQSNLPPVDLFRLLHHPRQLFENTSQVAMEFRQEQPLDYLLFSRQAVGGLWNNVPHNLLTLSPGQWMEFAFYPLAQYAQEQGLALKVNELIIKRDLINYYHHIPARFGQEKNIRTGVNVTAIEPHEKGFRLTANLLDSSTTQHYTCKYLILATGQRAVLRQLDVPGEDLPWVAHHYDKPEDIPGERVVVVGGGRSADWAATELHDAGKQVHYLMRQGPEIHWRLINDSRHGLPYYTRIAEILESRSPRLQTYYNSHIQEISEGAQGGSVRIKIDALEQIIKTDHVIKEIGGIADYSILKGFPPLSLQDKHDNYRFQVHQVKTHPHNYQALGIPNLYIGGYLSAGLEPVIIGMHGTTYAIAGDILQRENAV
jgi:thioredoxin reductase